MGLVILASGSIHGRSAQLHKSLVFKEKITPPIESKLLLTKNTLGILGKEALKRMIDRVGVTPVYAPRAGYTA